MDGVVVIDKPDGLTSHDVVAAVRRLVPNGTKVGHTGTLDPFATGVLPVLMGKATRLARFLSSDDKRYEATVAFGVSTTTYDRTGEVVDSAASGAVGALTRDRVAEALRAFVGVISQTPPVFSAKKVDGVRSYERARRGDTTPPAPVEVIAHALTLTGWNDATGHATVDVHCGAGFYVRSLAHDLGTTLGVPAHLHALRRTAAGPFREADARPLVVVLGGATEALASHVRPMSALLADIPAMTVTDVERDGIGHGRSVSVTDARKTVTLAAVHEGGRVRLLDHTGCLVALATKGPAAADGAARLHPDIVLL